MHSLTTESLQSQAWREDVARRGFSDDLPLIGGQSGIGGDMGSEHADFEVEEIPAYLPCGSGEHLYIRIEKSGKGTPDALKAIEKAFGVREIDVGCAGKKDAHAITRQWISIHTPSDDASPIDRLNALGWMRVLSVSRHANKLRLGHLKGNAFKVRIVGAVQDDAAIRAKIGRLSDLGFINYFGKQRFGFDGGNVAQGMAILAGRRAPHQKRLLLVSAVQSAMFNLMAAARACAVGNDAIEGDVLQKIHAGCFVCQDCRTDSERVARHEIAVTLPLFGKKTMPAQAAAAEFEKLCADAFFRAWQGDKNIVRETELNIDLLSKFASGDRRQFVVFPENLDFTRADSHSIDVRFALPSGCYATVLLRHLCGSSFAR